MSFMRWHKSRLSFTTDDDVSESHLSFTTDGPQRAAVSSIPFALTRPGGVSGLVTPQLIGCDRQAPTKTLRHQAAVADILNSLIRNGTLSWTDIREYTLTYSPNLQDWPIGTPERLELVDAVARLARRVKDLGG